MKIGILGAPGAEKSKFARGLAKNLDGNVAVVDHYVQRLKKASGLALGPWASYSENLMIAGVREAERAIKQGDHQITVGTIMDTMTYIMVYSDILISNNRAEDRAQIYHTGQAVVSGLSLWYTETWDYDVCFFLPFVGKVKEGDLVAGFSYTLDGAYSDVLDTFYVPNVFGLEGKTNERIEIAREVIERLTEVEDSQESPQSDPPSDEGQSVRRGSEDGAGGRDTPVAMSDMPID